MSSEPTAESPVSETPPAGRFAFIQRLLGRLRRQPAAAVDTAAAAGGADASAQPEPQPEQPAGAAPGKLAALRAWFDSPLKIVLVAASVLLLVLLIVLLVILLGKKSPKPAAADAHAPTAQQHAPAHSAAAPAHADKAHPDQPKAEHAPAAAAHPAPQEAAHSASDTPPHAAHEPEPGAAAGGKLEKPIQLILDPLAGERAKLAEERAALEKERAQLEADRKALTEQAGKALNGAVIGKGGAASGGSANLAGKCDLSGDKASLRDNLRRCLGLPDKPPETKDTQETKPGSAPAGKEQGRSSGH